MNISLETVKKFLGDRTLLSLSMAVIILGLFYVIYIALSLEQSDLQVATRYTAFGETHFYRNKWYYLISFVVFGISLIGVHLALSVKLFDRGHRQLAAGFLALTLLLLIVGWIITRSVLGIAFL